MGRNPGALGPPGVGRTRGSAEYPGEALSTAPVLVSGMYRSGTTWIARMLAAGGGVTVISEPFNPRHRQGILRAPFSVPYLYVTEENEEPYLPAVADTLRLRYRLGAEIRRVRRGRHVAKMAKNWAEFSVGRAMGRRPLLKDPFALLSAPWLARRFGVDVVVSVRHPAAVVSSTMRLGWKPFDFRDLLDQPLLVRDHLTDLREELERAAENRVDVLEAASLLWKVLYGTVARVAEASDIRMVRHEDLSLEPMDGFAALYGALQLPFTDGAQRRIAEATSARNPNEQQAGDPHSVRLDSRANVRNWVRRLSAEQVARIREITEEAAAPFYDASDWALD